MTEPDKPGILDRFRARYKWFDHVMRAQERYQDSKGDFYAAGITYFTIFALFPLLMVAFSIAGFMYFDSALFSPMTILNNNQRAANQNGVDLTWLPGTNQLQLYVSANDGTRVNVMSSVNSVMPNTMYHVAVTSDGPGTPIRLATS